VEKNSRTATDNNNMKLLKFAPKLVPLVLSGEKTCTWRMFDEKDFQVGDQVSFVGGGNEFAQAVIVSVREKRLGDITSEDEANDGHERFGSTEERLETYKGYYGDRVTLDTVVKILQFKITSYRSDN
jgi:hypothetical protein